MSEEMTIPAEGKHIYPGELEIYAERLMAPREEKYHDSIAEADKYRAERRVYEDAYTSLLNIFAAVFFALPGAFVTHIATDSGILAGLVFVFLFFVMPSVLAQRTDEKAKKAGRDAELSTQRMFRAMEKYD